MSFSVDGSAFLDSVPRKTLSTFPLVKIGGKELLFLDM